MSTASLLETPAKLSGRRPPSMVMRLARMGASFPTRLSFLPTLLRRLSAERVQVQRARWRMDAEGRGEAVYTLHLGGAAYSLVAFSTPLPPEQRTDRVIAEAWDATFALFDGEPDEADIERLRLHAPRQEGGRFTDRELILSRANRSERLFGHVVERLASGRQPDAAQLDAVGYLMRTTAVYGNGKFGIADRARIAERPGLSGPFQAEMLTVWLIRGFTIDLAEHVARERAPATAVALDRGSRQRLGVGNATGLGMAPFLVNHPALIDKWVAARETALERVCARRWASVSEIERAKRLFGLARAHLAGWRVGDPAQSERIAIVEAETPKAERAFSDLCSAQWPWRRLMERASAWSLETQELLVSLVIEMGAPEDDALADRMADRETRRLDPTMTIGALVEILDQRYGWTRRSELDAPPRYFWYVSEEKLEPRLGECGVDHGAERATALDIGRRVRRLRAALQDVEESETLAAFLRRRPEHRDTIRRVHSLADAPYAEIEDDLVGACCRPIDLLRFKLAFFGASHFDPKSDRWTRITLARGAPEFDDVAAGRGGDWSPIFGGNVGPDKEPPEHGA